MAMPKFPHERDRIPHGPVKPAGYDEYKQARRSIRTGGTLRAKMLTEIFRTAMTRSPMRKMGQEQDGEDRSLITRDLRRRTKQMEETLPREMME